MTDLPTTSKWVRLTELHPKFIERLEHLLLHDSRVKGKAKIVSGCRTYQQQKELYRKYKAGTGNLAANPDRRFGPNGKFRGSWHLEQEDGYAYAVDIRLSGGLSWAEFHAAADEVGIKKTVPSENWHMQPYGYLNGKWQWFPAPAMKGKEDKTLTKAAPPAAPAIVAKTMPIVRMHSRGEHVKVMQKKLTDLGFRVSKHPKKSGIDGVAGRLTIAGLKRFQRSRKLKADGLCGKLTWKALGI
jgi:hypothetical protein